VFPARKNNFVQVNGLSQGLVMSSIRIASMVDSQN